jgi:hypothetical protein
MNKTPIIGAGTDFTTSSNGYIASFLTDANDPALLNIPAGNFNFETYFEASSGGGSPTFYIELYKYDGTTFTLIASNSTSPKLINDGTNIEAYFSALAVPQTTLTLTDRLAIRIYVTTAGRTITLHTENGHLCQVITTFTTGLTALNGLTAQVQYLATGTSGTDFNIASASATHTFNLPTASATNRGALSSADWTTFNNKQNSLTLTTTGSSGDATLVGATLNIPNYTLAGLGGVPTSRTLTINGTTFDLSANRTWSVGTVTSVAALTIGTSGTDLSSTVANGTTTPVITLNVPTASATNRGALSSTDWTTFNNKQNALTNPVTGISASGRVAYFNGDTSITGSSNFFWDATNNRLGIGLNNPQRTLEIHNATADSQLRISGAAPSVSLGEAITGAIYQAKFGLITANGQYVTGGVAGDFVMISQTGATIFATSSTEKMRVQASGNVSIGNTNDTFRLDVTGTLRATGAATFSSSVNIASTVTIGGIDGSFLRTYSATNDALRWAFINSSTGVFSIQQQGDGYANQGDRLVINRSGNVGIGTPNPGFALDVHSGTAGSIINLNSTRLGGGGFAIANNSSARLYLGNANWLGISGESTSSTAIALASAENSAIIFATNAAASAAERMRITSGGNVGIGTTTTTGLLTLGKAGGGQYIGALNTTNGYEIGYLQFNTDNITINPQGGASGNDSYIRLLTAGEERMRITSGGAFKATNTGSYASTDLANEFNSSANLPTLRLTQTRTSGSEEMLRMVYSNFAPNNNVNWFIYANDTSAARFYVRSDGGIGNYQANDVNLSDIRTKKDITPLGSYWDKFKAIEMVKFKYKDQTHDDFNIGVIAQQVEKVAPEFVDVDGWGDTPKDGVPLKSVYTADLHHATIKVLQEAMAKIEDLQNQLDTLKNK